MNTQILNMLIAKAGFSATYERERLELFAKLIVQECVGITACNQKISGYELAQVLQSHFSE